MKDFIENCVHSFDKANLWKKNEKKHKKSCRQLSNQLKLLWRKIANCNAKSDFRCCYYCLLVHTTKLVSQLVISSKDPVLFFRSSLYLTTVAISFLPLLLHFCFLALHVAPFISFDIYVIYSFHYVFLDWFTRCFLIMSC